MVFMETDPINRSQTQRRLLHYLIAFSILIVYGEQVCPFLESLTLLELALPILGILIIQLIILAFALDHPPQKIPYKKQSKRVFQFEISMFVLGGVAVTLFNTVYYGFPLESGAKLLLAMSQLGFFIAIDLSLFKEWKLSQCLEKTGEMIEPDEHFFSQPKKLVLFTSICAFLTIGVIFLVINKDLDWFIHVGKGVPLESAQRSILAELGFVVGVILLYIINLVVGYSRNFSFFLSKETSVLKSATDGDFETQVPVVTNDEFGVMAKHTNLMVRGLKRQTEELQMTRDATILSLASLAETRDNETGNHILRTQRYVKVLAENLREQPEFSTYLNQATIDLLYKSAPLHDIGKVGIPDNILLKPGKLTDEEFKIMKRHPHLGSESLRGAEESLGSNSFLKLAREIALTHHEKWDGTGYPQGLKGNDIPLSGRLMAVADVYDALISKRVYKPAFTHEKAKEIILEWENINFDSRIVNVFLQEEKQFIQIAAELSDKN